METLRRRSTTLLGLLAAAAFATACGTRAAPEPDANPDATPPQDARVDAGPDAVVARDAGEVPTFDAGLPPCETPGYFDPHAARFSIFHMSNSGTAGNGLDLDDNPATCSPAGSCNGGIDNQIANLWVPNCGFADLDVSGFNYLMDSIVVTGDPPVNYLLETRGLTMNGASSAAPFTLVLHEGHWFPSPVCTEAASVLDDTLRCDYLTDGEMFAPSSCDALSVLPGAEIINGRLVAGGPSANIWIVYTVLGLSAGVVLHNARIEADVILNGNELALSNGVLGGVVCAEELMLILSAVLDVDPTACDMASKIPAPDLEIGCTPDDPDGISLGFTFEAHAGRIVGLIRN